MRKVCVLINYSNYYSINRVIGKGTYAKVVESTHLTLKKEFAVKLFEKTKIYKSADV